MLTSNVRFSLSVFTLAAAAACGGKDRSPEGPVAMSPPTSVRGVGPGDPACPRTGLWQPCALVDRIVHAGLSFKPTGDSVRVPFIAIPGVRYRVAMTDTLIAFFFRDSSALAKTFEALDTVRLAPRGDTRSPWQTRPNVIRSGNLLAVYFATSDRQVERLRLAITAGAPAPISTPVPSP